MIFLRKIYNEISFEVLFPEKTYKNLLTKQFFNFVKKLSIVSLIVFLYTQFNIKNEIITQIIMASIFLVGIFPVAKRQVTFMLVAPLFMIGFLTDLTIMFSFFGLVSKLLF